MFSVSIAACAAVAVVLFTASFRSTSVPVDNARYAPSKIFTRPAPPASTTPASFKTGRRFGVLSSDSFAASIACSMTMTISSSNSATLTAAAAHSRATVRMVPSVGRITAL